MLRNNANSKSDRGSQLKSAGPRFVDLRYVDPRFVDRLADLREGQRDGQREVQRGVRDARPTRRSAFTLFELIIVVAILVMVAALAAPAYRMAFSSHRLRQSADIIRGEWSRAKVNAIRRGEEFAFFYIPESGTYWIAPFNSAYADNVPQPSGDEDDRGDYDYGHGQLPRGISFYSGQAIEDTRSILAAEEGNVGGAANMILFYPDGTCQDAELYLKNDKDLYIRVSIRSLTGVASVSDLLSEPKVE